MLIKIDKNIWIKDSYFKSIGCKGSTRMTIVKTSDGLLIHSPVDLTIAEVQQINKLGDVCAIVAPNLFHYMQFAACAQHFQNATCWAAEGLADKVNNLPKHHVLDNQNPIFENDQVLQFQIQGHKLNETIFFHQASNTLITADFLYNYQAEQFRTEKLFFRLLGCYGKPAIPFYHSLSISNKAQFSKSLGELFKLDIKRIIMSHGRIIETPSATHILKSAWKKYTD